MGAKCLEDPRDMRTYSRWTMGTGVTVMGIQFEIVAKGVGFGFCLI